MWNRTKIATLMLVVGRKGWKPGYMLIVELIARETDASSFDNRLRRVAKIFSIIAFSLLLFLLGQAAPADAQPYAIDAEMNIFGSGQSTPPDPSGGGGGALPLEFNLPAGANRVLFFTSVTGLVNFSNGMPGYTFDANGDNTNGWTTDELPWNGISGIIAVDRIGFLTGCFLSDDAPVDPPPTTVVFTNFDFISFSPVVAQLFFIGDGVTSEGQPHIFRIPDGATRLFLGFVDSLNITTGGEPGWYDDNIGDVVASFQITGLDPDISSISVSANACLLTVTNLIPDLSYQLISADTITMTATNWSLVQSFVAPNSGVFQCTDSNAVALNKFYRVTTTVP